MAEYISYDDNTLVNGETVLSFINCIENDKEIRSEILKNNNIIPEYGKWYKQQDWLNAFKELNDKLGHDYLYLIGKSIIENAIFPDIKDLKEALQLLDQAYHLNHKNGYIGNYKLVSFDMNTKTAIMECNNPYPSKFDEGIITSLVELYKPNNSYQQVIYLDENKPSRNNGDDSCTFIIKW